MGIPGWMASGTGYGLGSPATIYSLFAIVGVCLIVLVIVSVYVVKLRRSRRMCDLMTRSQDTFQTIDVASTTAVCFDRSNERTADREEICVNYDPSTGIVARKS